MVAKNNEALVKSTTIGLEQLYCAPTDFQLAEWFGGGSEYFFFWRPPFWPFSFIRLFGQEDE